MRTTDDGRLWTALAVVGLGTLAAVVDRARTGSAATGRRDPSSRRDEAVAVYGTTDDPTSVGFLLADGRWLDFSEGSGMGRAQDHRHVAGLLDDDEQAPEHVQGARTI